MKATAVPFSMFSMDTRGRLERRGCLIDCDVWPINPLTKGSQAGVTNEIFRHGHSDVKLSLLIEILSEAAVFDLCALDRTASSE